jgi:AcrR family transcriptional regulator
MNVDPDEHGTKHATKQKGSSGRPRSPAVDRAILQAALELFVERGLEGMGIEQVAERAGVARTTVYRRWPSKEFLIAEAIAQGRGSSDDQVLRDSILPRNAVKSLINALAGTATSTNYRKMVARLIGSIPDQPKLMEIYFRTYLGPRRKIAADAFELARTQGLIREDADREIVLDLVAGAIIYRLLIYRGKSSEKDMRAYLHKVLHVLRLEDVK